MLIAQSVEENTISPQQDNVDMPETSCKTGNPSQSGKLTINAGL
jgi:hypothetical protein